MRRSPVQSADGFGAVGAITYQLLFINYLGGCHPLDQLKVAGNGRLVGIRAATALFVVVVVVATLTDWLTRF